MPQGESKGVLFTIAMPLAILMLVFWAVMTFAFSGPGWVHLFLSLGVFLLIWRIVSGSGKRERGSGERRAAGRRESGRP